MKKYSLILTCICIFSMNIFAQTPSVSDYIEVDQEPKPLNMSEVQKEVGYPFEARKNCVQGNVVLRILLDEQGAYVQHEVLNNPYPALTEAVEAHVSKLSFSPAVKEGQSVKFWANVPFSFKLLGECEPAATSKEEGPDVMEFIEADTEPIPQNMRDIKIGVGYPKQAREHGIEGMVVARVLVDRDGEYVRHEIIKHAHPVLEDAVVPQLPKLTFSPAMREGNPVPFWVNLPFSFILINNNSKKNVNTDLSISELGILQVYPNPGDRTLMVQLRSHLLIEEAQLELMDQQGKVLFSEAYYPETKEWTHQVDISSLSSGMYQVKVITKDQIMVKSLVKK